LGEPEKAAKGKLLKGRRHTHGGTMVRVRQTGQIVEAEKDELIMTKGVYLNQKSRDAASALNELRGGIRFPGVSSSYPQVLEQMQGIVSSSAARTVPVSPRLPNVSFMQAGGILGAQAEGDLSELNDTMKEVVETNKEIIEATKKTKVAVPVRGLRDQLNALESEEARRFI